MQDVPIIIAPPPRPPSPRRRDCIVQDGRRYCEDEAPTPEVGYFLIGVAAYATIAVLLSWLMASERIRFMWFMAWLAGVPILAFFVAGIAMVIR